MNIKSNDPKLSHGCPETPVENSENIQVSDKSALQSGADVGSGAWLGHMDNVTITLSYKNQKISEVSARAKYIQNESLIKDVWKRLTHNLIIQ